MDTQPSHYASGDRTPEQVERDNALAAKWHKTATQPWSEHMKTVQANSAWAQMQGSDDAENEASKKRVQDYITKYKHLF